MSTYITVTKVMILAGLTGYIAFMIARQANVKEMLKKHMENRKDKEDELE